MAHSAMEREPNTNSDSREKKEYATYLLPYTKEEFCLVLSPTHRLAGRKQVSLQELQTEPIIIRESGSGSRYAVLSLLEEHKVKPSVLIEAGSVLVKPLAAHDRNAALHLQLAGILALLGR